MKFEAGKEYTTRGGRTAKVYAVHGGGLFRVHGAILSDSPGIWTSTSWTEEGHYRGKTSPCSRDLMLPKLTKTKYMFLYADGTVGMSDYPSLYRAGCEVVATEVVELVEGEFGFELPLAGVKE